MLNPDLNDYHITAIIAECSGGMAVVYSAKYKPTEKNVAIKKYFVDKCKEKTNFIQQDILTRKELQHANILPYLTSFVNGRELYVVSPLMIYGSCRDILNSYFQEGLPELASAMIIRDTLLALQYLHKQLYIHRSVRAGHILIGADGIAKLSGLRSAGSLMVNGKRVQHLYNLPPSDHGNVNLMWLSPELLEQNLKGYDERSDIYSVGVVCCELGNGAVPFADVPTTLMLTEKMRGSRPQLLDCSTFPQPHLDEDEIKSGVGDCAVEVARLRQMYANRKFSDSFHQVCDLALQREPEKRPTASQLLNHAFFKQIRKTDFLPALLRCVQPVQTNASDMSALVLQEKMAEMDIEKTIEWDF